MTDNRDVKMTIEEILRKTYNQILKEHNIALTDVSFDLSPLRCGNGEVSHLLNQIEIKGKCV